MNKIYVVGIGFRPLEKKAVEAVLHSDVVLANSRLLDVFKSYDEYENVKDKIIVHGSVYEMLDYIVDNYQTKIISLIAAGDPMFFGIGRLVVEKLGQDAVEVYPDLSSVQVAFSRIRETSNNALLISFHGGPDPEKRRKLEYDITELPSLLERHSKIAILTDTVNSPAEIAKEILKPSAFSIQLSALKMYVCEKLGYADERITEGTPEEIAKGSFEHPNVVILVRSNEDLHFLLEGAGHDGGESSLANIPFGLKESEINHAKGLITKDEIRAVTLHKLRLPQQGVLWDVGAGSGSVSIEATRLCPGLKVYAIEKKEEQVRHLNENKECFKAKNIEIIKGEAPEILRDLPAPDRVFIGGSGGKLKETMRIIIGKMSSGIMVINAATIETLNDAVQCLAKNDCKVDVSEVSIARSRMVGQKRHMSALNPVFIVSGEKA